MEPSNIHGKRSILLGYFTSHATQNGKMNTGSLIFSPASESIEKITHGEMSKRIFGWRDSSKSAHQITIFSDIQETNTLRSIFPMLEEVCLVYLGELNAVEEDNVNVKFEHIRQNIRRACSALCQQVSVDAIEIDPCDNPKIAAESAIYGIFRRNEIEIRVPKDSYFFDVNTTIVSPVSVQHLVTEINKELPEESVKAFEEGVIIGECQNFARLLHGAGFFISCAEFIQYVEEKLSCLKNVKVLRRNEDWMKNKGMKSILQVGSMNRKCTEQGKFYTCFQQPACLLEIHYDSSSSSRPITLVGRSSFYHNSDSYFMTEDRQPVDLIQNVSGGASIIATILAIIRLKIPVNVIGIIAMCVHSFWWRKALNKNIETEFDVFSEVPDSHEERLILKDAVTYACSFEPELIITVGTQTNYLTEAFQSFTSVMYSSDDSIAELFLKACSDTGERFIRLPFVDIEDDIFNECIIKKQFCSDCRDALNRPIPLETRYQLAEYISKNWDFCFVTSFCLQNLLKEKKWLHLELNKALLIQKNEEKEIYALHEITGAPTRSFIYFIQRLLNSK